MSAELEQAKARYEALSDTLKDVLQQAETRLKDTPADELPKAIVLVKKTVTKTMERALQANENLIDITIKEDPSQKAAVKTLELERCDIEENVEALFMDIEQLKNGGGGDNKEGDDNDNDGGGDDGAGAKSEEEAEAESSEEEDPLSPMARACLDAHNKYRAKHGAPDLVWDEKLHGVAQKYAEYLARTNQFHHSNNGYGENLAGGMGENEADAVRYATKMWYDEVSQYNYSYGGFSMSTGHFTQVVWKGTKSVGIGASYCNARRYWIVCANYSPPGNYQGQFQQNVFPPR